MKKIIDQLEKKKEFYIDVYNRAKKVLSELQGIPYAEMFESDKRAYDKAFSDMMESDSNINKIHTAIQSLQQVVE